MFTANEYQAAGGRYEGMQYNRCGQSGLETAACKWMRRNLKNCVRGLVPEGHITD